MPFRITRICSELRELLLARDYKPKVIDSAIEKAKQISREEALKRVVRNKTSSRPVLVVPYHPGLPNIPKIVQKHHRVMTHQRQANQGKTSTSPEQTPKDKSWHAQMQ